MLPRLLQRSKRHLLSSTLRDVCRVCTCNCGRTTTHNAPQKPATRSYASRQHPPSSNSHAGAASVKQHVTRQGLGQAHAARLSRVFARRKLEGSLRSRPDQLLAFVERFADLAAIKAPKAGPGLDVSTFKEMVKESGTTFEDARWCAHWLLSNTEEALRQLGRKMMYTLSHAGDGWATLIIMEGTLAESSNRASLLKSSELMLVRRQLAEMAAGNLPDALDRREQMFMAMVCEGRVAACLDNFGQAISMWSAAMDDAINYANQRGDKAGDILAVRANSSPWIDLYKASIARGNTDTARWAAEIGCRLDDPVSHYHAALLEQQVEKRGSGPPTSAWLYHMIKAAGSGHVKAIHAIGIYYSAVEWKYLQDEPPDQIKPTPFDSFPFHKQAEQSYGQRFGAVFGLQPSSVMDPRESLFLTATFPSEPHERWKLAMSWLDAAMGLMYAPSFLAAAKLFMQRTLSTKSVAPKEALQLSDQRYEYASKADREAGKKFQSPEMSTSAVQTPGSIPNPSFDLEKAKDLIREVFYAVQAQVYHRRRLSEHGKARSQKPISTTSSTDKNTVLSEQMLDSNISPNISKWLRLPELMQTYTEGKQGTLYDDFTNVDITAEARRICDKRGWDLYDDDGGLLYKHS